MRAVRVDRVLLLRVAPAEEVPCRLRGWVVVRPVFDSHGSFSPGSGTRAGATVRSTGF